MIDIIKWNIIIDSNLVLLLWIGWDEYMGNFGEIDMSLFLEIGVVEDDRVL